MKEHITIEKLLQSIAKYETCLYSCAIEGNEFTRKHIDKIEGIYDVFEQYEYLKGVFDELEKEFGNRIEWEDE